MEMFSISYYHFLILKIGLSYGNVLLVNMVQLRPNPKAPNCDVTKLLANIFDPAMKIYY